MTLTRLIPALAIGLALAVAPAAFAAGDNTDTTGSAKPVNHHDTAKGAAVGALAGHEIGSGHALVGAGVGAAVGHHEEKKAERKNSG
ncbi:MAG TPA: glycine zipper domain-containing protein [Acetobacteraceae bacterium]|nr:glycine zipper domain-containing protein [Acetobacteraceae bacterium]